MQSFSQERCHKGPHIFIANSFDIWQYSKDDISEEHPEIGKEV